MFEESDAQNTVVVIAATFVIMTMGIVVPVISTNPKIMAQPPFPIGGGKYKFGTISSINLTKIVDQIGSCQVTGSQIAEHI